MEIYNTEDKLVTKYVHNDGSETCIKVTPSCGLFYFDNNDNIKVDLEDSNKYTVFVSSSVGCKYNCKFCFLTIKKFPYHPLTKEEILSNLKESVKSFAIENQDIKNKFIKLSFMGMGDAFLLNKGDIFYISYNFLNWIFDNNYAKGISGIDLGSINPNEIQIEELINLRNKISKFSKNTHIDIDLIRIFISLYSTNEIMREYLLNFNNEVETNLIQYKERYFPIIIHHMFFDKLNDYDDDIEDLIRFINLFNIELRILRYNKCENSEFNESPKFNQIVKYLSSKIEKIKIQLSPGSEIMASCGMFICKEKEE